MLKRRLLAVLIAIGITFGVTAMWSAMTFEREGDADVNFIEESGSEAGLEGSETSRVEKKSGGNKVAKLFKAPFKAFGKLFGRKDDNKLQRMTEEDAEKFESVGVARVEDGTDSEQKKFSVSGSAREHLDAGRALLLNGRLNQAITELSTAASLDPKLAEAHNLLGVAFDKKGMPERARESYERAVKAQPEDAQTLNNLGFSLYQNGNYRAAIDKLKRAAKLAPADERILNNLGLALCRMGKFDDAYKNFARAAGPLTGSLNTAKMLERFAREEEAIKYYEMARRIDPNNSFAQRRLADLYQRTGKAVPVDTVQNPFAGVATEATAVISGR